MIEWVGISERDLGALIAHLNASRKITEDSNVRYEGDPLFEDVVGVLESVLQFPEEVPGAESRRAVGAALFAGNEPELESEALRQEIEDAVATFLNKTPSSYVLVASVSVKHFEELTEKEICGCRLSFHRQPPEPFRNGHLKAEDRAYTLVPGEFRNSLQFRSLYTVVTVETEGRSEVEAGMRAQRALEVQRGIWNLALKNAAVSPPGTGPLNYVLPGPVQSLHLQDGEALIWPIWYEPKYTGPVRQQQARRLSRHWEEVQNYESLVEEGLAGSRYRTQVEDFVRDYARILDGHDPEASFVQMWGLLERLVGIGEGDRQAAVVRRAAFLVRSGQRGLQRQVLHSLRHHRNAGVHEGILPDGSRNLLRQCTRFATLGIEFHLDENFDFGSLEEAGSFLCQPSEAGPLSQRIRTLKQQGRKDDLKLARLAAEFHGHSAEDLS